MILDESLLSARICFTDSTVLGMLAGFTHRMKESPMHRTPTVVVLLTLLLSVLSPSHALAQTHAFTYQGSLSDSGGMADGTYDFKCSLHASPTGATSLGSVTLLGIEVVDGLFHLELDFGSSVYTAGADRYLQIGVRMDGESSFTTLDPRIRLDSVPFASHAAHADSAEVADYASSGPFQPIDTTPGSDSGTPRQTITYALSFNGSSFNGSFEVEYPIQISRDSIVNSSGIFPGNFRPFEIRLTKDFNANDQWHDHFSTAANRVRLDITVGSTSLETSYSFDQGVVSGYELGYDRNLTESIVVTYSPDGGLPALISDRVNRDATGLPGHSQSYNAPSLGGTSSLPGDMDYHFDQINMEYAGAGSLPAEARLIANGFPTNSFDSASLAHLVNVHEDRDNLLWELFADGGGTERLELRSGNTLVWTPGIFQESFALITGWTLERADDDGLFETYIYEYTPNVITP